MLQFCSGSALIFIQVGGSGLISAGQLYTRGKSRAWVPPSQAWKEPEIIYPADEFIFTILLVL